MKTLINGYEVDMTLENEKTLSEVISSVSEWARQRNLIFTQFEADGEGFSTESFPDRKCDEVDTLNCVIQSKADLILSTLSEGTAYCDKLMSFIDKAEREGTFDLAHADSFANGVQWLTDSLRSIMQLLSLDPSQIRYLDRSVTEYLEALSETAIKVESEHSGEEALSSVLKARSVIDVVKGVFRMLLLSDSLKTVIVQSLESPDELAKALETVRDSIAEQEESLALASAAFQSGKDAEGAEKLQGFTDFVYRYVRVCHQISPVFGIDPAALMIGDLSLEGLNASLHAYLEEIVSAMENGDIVTLSDILEYEVKPQMDTIRSFVNIMLEKMGR